MTKQDINDIISTMCPDDVDFEKPIISPAYLKKELEALAVEQESTEFEEIDFVQEHKKIPVTLDLTPCEDAISRRAVEEMIKAEMPERGMWEIDGDKEKETVCEVCVDLIQKLSELSPVAPQPKTGHWVFVDRAKEHGHCSECDYGNVDLLDGRPHNYCPNCGAKMQ